VAGYLQLPATTAPDGQPVRVEPFAVHATRVGADDDRLAVLVRLTVVATGVALPAALLEVAYDSSAGLLTTVGSYVTPALAFGGSGSYRAAGFLADGRLALVVNQEGGGVRGVELRTAPPALTSPSVVDSTSTSSAGPVPAVGLAVTPTEHVAIVLRDASLVLVAPDTPDPVGPATIVTVTGPTGQLTLVGLRPGQTYLIDARVANSVGSSPSSAPYYYTVPALESLNLAMKLTAGLGRLSPTARALSAHLDWFTGLLYVPLTDGAMQWVAVWDLAQLGVGLPPGLGRDLPVDPHTPEPLRPIDPPEPTYRPAGDEQFRPGADSTS
jgi:hypothetical protein